MENSSSKGTALSTMALSVVAFSVVALPNTAMAWNYQGHVAVGEIAYQNLNDTARHQVDILAEKAYESLPADVQKKMDSFEGASRFAALAMVPDMIRKQPASEVWEEMGETIPAPLNQWDEKQTGQWHYINLTYPATSQCNFVKEPNIRQVGTYLYSEFQQQPQAASLMFLSHIAGDSHQPMHSVAYSLSKWRCKSDFGGNLYTLDVPEKDLHHLWDSGMGLLEKPHNIHEFAASLQEAYPRADMMLGDTGDVSLWVEESYDLADFAYQPKIDSKPSQAYIEQGQEKIKQRLAKAGYRLADELNTVFPQQ